MIFSVFGGAIRNYDYQDLLVILMIVISVLIVASAAFLMRRMGHGNSETAQDSAVEQKAPQTLGSMEE